MSERIRRLIILRHGQTDYNLHSRMQGQLDTQLTDHGRQQAHTTANYLSTLKPLRIISSDLQRAYDTAVILAAHHNLPVETDSRLRETHLGYWQGLTHQDIDARAPGQRLAWRQDPTWAPDGGESRVDVAQRTYELVQELLATQPEWGSGIHAQRPIILVAHGGVTAALTAILLGLPIENWPVLGGMGNASWTQLSAHEHYDTGQLLWRLDIWNASAQVAGDVL